MNLPLAALDSFYAHLGLGRPVVRLEGLPARAPRALTEEQQRPLLRMAERASARDRAIVVVLLYTGLRLAELVALDRPRQGVGAQGHRRRALREGDAYREVPLNALVRQVLEEWLTERQARAGETERALFVGRPVGDKQQRAIVEAWLVRVRSGQHAGVTRIGVEHSPETGRADDSF